MIVSEGLFRWLAVLTVANCMVPHEGNAPGAGPYQGLLQILSTLCSLLRISSFLSPLRPNRGPSAVQGWMVPAQRSASPEAERPKGRSRIHISVPAHTRITARRAEAFAAVRARITHHGFDDLFLSTSDSGSVNLAVCGRRGNVTRCSALGHPRDGTGCAS